ncbi:hypothetical protein B9Z55_022902 [Caenorhabditis nigoni]|uniref:Uncharacterized protein n=1 Tax=Caenorhabditis nigoni TaxID=1611254 RepID=A0A2G5SMX4_9PELO|nr:hypothetical protein B9Z55_022902 [Caenorhabditis nigoni]
MAPARLHGHYPDENGLPTHSSTCTKVHGLDCELVHTMNGLEVARARIEIMKGVLDNSFFHDTKSSV